MIKHCLMQANNCLFFSKISYYLKTFIYSRCESNHMYTVLMKYYVAAVGPNAVGFFFHSFQIKFKLSQVQKRGQREPTVKTTD